MLVTPSNSRRTVKPATAVTNHMKVRRRENAGRRTRIAFHQIAHSDGGSARSGMVASMVQVGSGHPIGTMDSQFVNHVWAHDPDPMTRTTFAACKHCGGPCCGSRDRLEFRRFAGNTDVPEHTRARQYKTGRVARTRSRTSWASHARNIRKRTVSSRTTHSSKDYSSGWTRLK